MGTIVQTTDFATGDIKISQNNTGENDLEIVITGVENDILPDLFGNELYDLFIADLAEPTEGEPTDQRFIDVFEPFRKEIGSCEILKSEGIKRMLMWFIFAEYSRDQSFQNTVTGTVMNKAENSNIVSGAKSGWAIKYNKGVDSYNDIRRFMHEESETYPEGEGVYYRLLSAVL